ncbi:hypothetical protein [Fundidesulfovibrio terrae]|uniref:hypothetical protein n=1 Tax=Fundidesulfovibrio terrae TaxID=2922866 RepID=UPI001FAE8729|nr:hypothetical protein [Fundidesulfovibrio terrae]
MKSLIFAVVTIISLTGMSVVIGELGLNSLKSQVAGHQQKAHARQSAEMQTLLAML